jgi:hypothetical protein
VLATIRKAPTYALPLLVGHFSFNELLVLALMLKNTVERCIRTRLTLQDLQAQWDSSTTRFGTEALKISRSARDGFITAP